MARPVLGGLEWVDAVLRDAVSRVAATEADPADPLRGLYLTDDAAREAATRLVGAQHRVGLDRLAAALEIDDDVDLAVLSLCAAPELDARYGQLIGYLHDDLSRRRMTPRLADRLLASAGGADGDGLARLAATAPLRRDRALFLRNDDQLLPVADRPVLLDELLVAILLGAQLSPDGGISGVRVVAHGFAALGRADLIASLQPIVQEELRVSVAVVGDDAEPVLAQALGADLVVLGAADFGDETLRARARLRARLHGGYVVVGDLDQIPDDRRGAFRRALGAAGPTFIAAGHLTDLSAAVGNSIAVHVITVPPLAASERRACWAAALDGVDLGDTAERLPMSATEIVHVARIAGQRARQRGGATLAAEVLSTSRELGGRALGPLARRLEPGPSWDDLVLPEWELQILKSIPGRVRLRDRVMTDWGFERLAQPGNGVTALFSGESGTGKTLAARIIAGDLRLEAFRVDLSAIVSKYIGETEKNLDRIFSSASGVNSVLVFDEADALFGRRSAVSDARDRYANLEVAYLLQRVEEHDGVVILTTNLRQNIDSAFLRRSDFAVEFPVPDASGRSELWRRHIPRQAPLGADVDLAELAGRHDLSGGSIAHCARAAAFSAAEDGGLIGAAHLERAIDLELRKLGRLGRASR